MINSQTTNNTVVRGPGRPRGSNYSKRVTSFLSDSELELINRIMQYGGDGEESVATVSEAIRYALHKTGDLLLKKEGNDV
jgi:hypothetical protein